MKDIIYRLESIYNELKIRKGKNRLKRYNAGKIKHEKQLLFHKCKKRNRWVFGGNRCGKTECGAVEVIYMARGIHPYRENKKDTVGWVVSLTSQVQRDVVQQKIFYYLNPDWIEDVVMLSGKKGSPENGIIDYILIRNVFGGLSKIGFRNCEQGREKFQGTSLNYVWFDEEPPQDIYTECRLRVMDKEGDIFGTMTPLRGLNWIYNEIYLNESQNPEVWYEQMSWNDNPFLSPKEIELLSSTLSVSELENRKFGRFTGSEGLVYNEFNENVNVIDPFKVPENWYDNISIDPGLNNPLSAHWYAVDYDSNVYVIAEHYAEKKDIDYHAKRILEISESLNWPKDHFGKISALIDSAANQKTLASSKSVSELFCERGINVNPKVNKDVFSGISRVKSFIKDANGQTKLFVFRTCPNMIREFKSYFWGEGDNPKKTNDHSMDELRYYIMSKPQPKKTPISKTNIEKHKEKLIRQSKYRNNNYINLF